MIVSAAENLVVRRPLRDTGKWDRLMLRYASVQLLVVIAVAWLHKRMSLVISSVKTFVKEIRLSHLFGRFIRKCGCFRPLFCLEARWVYPSISA